MINLIRLLKKLQRHRPAYQTGRAPVPNDLQPPDPACGQRKISPYFFVF